MRLFNLLSLDVVLGAMAGMLFFVHLAGETVGISLYVLLALTVWTIYTLDHLSDAKAIPGKAMMERHRFHQENFKSLSIGVFVSAGLVIFILFTRPEVSFIIWPGLYVALGMGVLLLVIKISGPKFAWLKELSTAIFYVAGISLIGWKLQQEVTYQYVLFQLAYILLAWLNLLILSYLDEKEDKKSGFGSIFSLLHKPKVKLLIWGVGGIGLMLALNLWVFLGSYYRIYAGILVLLIYFHMYRFGTGVHIKKTSRQILEASFLLPFILLLF